ncbi:MAG: hypothetical protein ACJA1A_003606, partial [Saprospiraceae bacterium]
MRTIILFLLPLVLAWSYTESIQAQCPYDNFLFGDLTPAAAGDVVGTTCAWGGDYYTVDVTAGETYIFSTCADLSGTDTQLTLYDAAGITAFDFDDDGCPNLLSTITWVATFTGTVHILLDEYDCVDGATCVDLSVTWVGTPPPANCTDNDECLTPTTIVLPASTSGSSVCLTDCNTGATSGPDSPGVVCQDLPNPTVWYTFTTDNEIGTLDITLNSADLTEPEFTIFTTPDCADYTTIACVEGTGGTAAAVEVDVLANTTYIIAVSGAAGGEGDFDLCLTPNENTNSCNITNTLIETASSDPATPVGGPYSAGEVVSFSYTLDQWIKVDCNWISGIVPTFGDCWDPASFDANGMPLLNTPPATAGGLGVWSWYADGEVTYNNITGSLPAGTPTGAGWYFVCTGCAPGNNGPSPNESFGDGGNCPPADDGFTWAVSFDLVAGPNSNCTGGSTDCGVSMKTYADGEVGAFEDVSCTADEPSSLAASFLCCPDPVFTLSSSNPTTCGGTDGTISLSGLSDIATYDISYTGPAGLVILGSVSSTGGTYIITGLSAGDYTDFTVFDGCGTGIDVTIITLADPPAPAVAVSNSGPICADVTSFTLNETGGDPIVSWSWSSNGAAVITNTGDQSPTVTGAVNGEIFTVIVTDTSGCTGSGSDMVEVFALPTVTFTAPADVCP